jgi:hypothetical protein
MTWPLAKLCVSADRLVVEPRFGLARLFRPWDVEREAVAYIGARARGSLMTERVWIVVDASTGCSTLPMGGRSGADRGGRICT